MIGILSFMMKFPSRDPLYNSRGAAVMLLRGLFKDLYLVWDESSVRI